MARRLPLLVLTTLALLGSTGVAQAQRVRCSHQLIHDWYQDGRINGRYSVSCYRTSLAQIPSGDPIYGTIRQDVSYALSSGLDRLREQGTSVGPQTVLASPVTRSSSHGKFLASPAKGKSTSWFLSLAAAAALVLMLLAWCISRWRKLRPPSGT